MNATANLRFTTGTATVAIFDPARLQHRLEDSADWWSIPADEVAEINRGNMLTVSTGSDGSFDATVFCHDELTNETYVEALIICESGRLFVGPGEVLPSDGLTSTDEYGGRFLDLPAATYQIRVSRSGAWSLRISIRRTDRPAENHFRQSPRLG
jgi:hypothetical protein